MGDAPQQRPGSARKTDADDFDSVAWFYDWMPVPTHPKRLAPRLAGIEGTVLDLGGGTGKFSVRMLDPRKNRILVVDPAANMLRKGRRKKRPFQGVQGVSEALPFGDKSVAAIVATEAFHHFADQQNVVQEAARVLQEDGLLLIEETDPTRLIGRIMSWMEQVQGMSSVFYPPQGLMALLASRFDSVTMARTGTFTYVVEATGPHP